MGCRVEPGAHSVPRNRGGGFWRLERHMLDQRDCHDDDCQSGQREHHLSVGARTGCVFAMREALESITVDVKVLL
jgi:hypothetical protein